MSEQAISELDRLANRLLEASTRAFGITAAISHIVDQDDCLSRGTGALMDHFCDDLEEIAKGIHELVKASRRPSAATEPSQCFLAARVETGSTAILAAADALEREASK